MAQSPFRRGTPGLHRHLDKARSLVWCSLSKIASSLTWPLTVLDFVLLISKATPLLSRLGLEYVLQQLQTSTPHQGHRKKQVEGHGQRRKFPEHSSLCAVSTVSISSSEKNRKVCFPIIHKMYISEQSMLKELVWSMACISSPLGQVWNHPSRISTSFSPLEAARRQTIHTIAHACPSWVKKIFFEFIPLQTTFEFSKNRNRDDALHNPTANCPRSSPVLERVTKRALRAVLMEDSSDTPTGIIRCSQAPPGDREPQGGSQAAAVPPQPSLRRQTSEVKTGKERCVGVHETLLPLGSDAVCSNPCKSSLNLRV